MGRSYGNKRLNILLLIFLLIPSCGKKASAKYCGPNNCGPNTDCKNLGHRLGGDMQHIADNRLASIPKAVKYEDHACFLLWEFDVRSAKDKLIVYHDTKYKGKFVTSLKAKELPFYELPRDILDALYRLPNKKKIGIDTKHILPEHEEEFFELVSEYINKKMNIHLRAHCSRKKEGIFIRAKERGFKLSFYRCKGEK